GNGNHNNMSPLFGGHIKITTRTLKCPLSGNMYNLLNVLFQRFRSHLSHFWFVHNAGHSTVEHSTVESGQSLYKWRQKINTRRTFEISYCKFLCTSSTIV
ncbi:unnamed protein product, partial [Owenia fusiformis]